MRELVITLSPDDLAREAAGRLIELIADAIRQRGRASIALSGGSTPKRLYQLLTQPPYSLAIDWSKVHLFFADERFVPHDDPDSTVQLVRETLLAGVKVPEDHFHTMPTTGATPEACAAQYEETLRHHFGSDDTAFDLTFLGMGPDGHTASLFPGFPVSEGLVAPVYDSPKPPPVRLTLTYGALRKSRAIWFLVTGADKADPLEAVFASDPHDASALPAARIFDREGHSLWLTDPDAARRVAAAP
jgi:6-phosphogluconolactonase